MTVPIELQSVKAELIHAAKDWVRGLRGVALSYSANDYSAGLKGSLYEKRGNHLLDSVSKKIGSAPYT